MKPYLRFGIVWLANYLVIYYGNIYYPMYYALGNASLTPLKASLFSSLLLTLAGKIAKTTLPQWGIKAKGRYQKYAVYWLVNSVAIWLIARFAFVTGFGIRAYYYALTLGIAVTTIQWLVRQAFKYAKLI